ncbi:MAG: alpha/beta hydrolase [Anaerolineae bacterium]|nr:alpha/beta hydrolase [Anaerolineae bacterium]
MITPSAAERRIRAGLPVIRFLQTWLPVRWSRGPLRAATARARTPADVTRQAVSADGVPCEWLIPQGSPPHRALVYLHGGGFVYGVTPQHVGMVARLARTMGVRALMVDYRLAPEHPFPAALDDCVAAYRWLLRQGVASQDIVLAGDSAGGNLVITTMMKLRDGGEPLPAAAACLSPVADLSDRPRPARFRDPLLPLKAVRFYNESYVASHDARDPFLSPVYGDWRGLPPLLVHVGEEEVLRDDAVRITEAAAAAGVVVRLEIYPRMWHVWQLFPVLPQAAESLDDIARFLGAHLAA